MPRKFFVGGNWKMNGSKKVAEELLGTLAKGPLDPNVGELPQDMTQRWAKVTVAPPFLGLKYSPYI